MGNLRSTSWIARFGAKGRLGTALAVAAVVYVVQPDAISWHTRAVASWDLGALAYLGLAWMLIGRTDARATRDHALSQDQSGYIIFLFVVGASCASILAIGFVVGTIRDPPFWIRAWHGFETQLDARQRGALRRRADWRCHADFRKRR